MFVRKVGLHFPIGNVAGNLNLHKEIAGFFNFPHALKTRHRATPLKCKPTLTYFIFFFDLLGILRTLFYNPVLVC